MSQKVDINTKNMEQRWLNFTNVIDMLTYMKQKNEGMKFMLYYSIKLYIIQYETITYSKYMKDMSQNNFCM